MSQILKLPKGTLRKLNLGQAFAEYDGLLEKDNVFVETPALRAALDGGRGKCFFVGRRGTGKTAITLYLERKLPRITVTLLPQLLVPISQTFEMDAMQDVHRQPFKSLVCSFKRAILDEVLKSWMRRGRFAFRNNTSAALTRERNFIEDYEFDVRLLTFAQEALGYLATNQHKEWLRQINRWKEVGEAADDLMDSPFDQSIVLIDRVDESWDGSDQAVVVLTAMMHACVELNASCRCVKPLLFLRENVFERVRLIDKEFARLETFVISMEWTKELLVELLERRLNVPLIAKFPLRGQTWTAYFEDGATESSQDLVFNFCQYRPREVLVYCSFAIEAAQSRMREKVFVEDLLQARRRFSDSRLKDLCDEYADNLPRLQLVLSRFYGLGQEFTVQGVTDFLKKLLVDDEIKTNCRTWIFRHTQPDLFMQLLFNIGFAGIRVDGVAYYRSLGSQSTTPPPVDMKASLVIHPTYREALNLRDVILTSLDPATPLKGSGMLEDLPQGIQIEEYNSKLRELREQLKTLPHGQEHAEEYANLVGETLRLCFFRVLTNLEPKVRSIDGRVIRDWIAANHAPDGFWELVRQKYGSTQIVFECKNYADLEATDFHQVAYYMNSTIGYFGIVVFRGNQLKPHYFGHIKRIATDNKGLVLMLTDNDLDIFLRQGLVGKSSESHLRELFDHVVREVS